MANILPMEKQITVIGALAEGNSIRSIERMTGIHRDTVMRLGIKIGEGCDAILDKTMRGLKCKKIQVDEIWGFIQKKQRHVKKGENAEFGDVWTFVAIDADSKLVPTYLIGKRTSETANEFVTDLSSRLENRIQLSSDGLRAYTEAVEQGFGGDVDYGQIVKTFSTTTGNAAPEAKYSPGDVTSIEKTVMVGNPDEDLISTSYIERQNLTMRMHIRRLTRLTNGFSKKLDNFKAAVGLHFAYYNFVKIHGTLRCTPAMKAGVTNEIWSIAELVEMAKNA